MARPKKDVSKTEEAEKEVLTKKSVGEAVVSMVKKEVFVPEEVKRTNEESTKVVEKIVEVEKVVSAKLFSEEDSLFLRDFLNFTQALYNESNSVSVRVKLQRFNRLMDAALTEDENR